MGKKAAKKSMPILATGISIKYGIRRSCAAVSRGFTLLELLVVVAIIGIFVGAAALSIGIVGNDREVEQEAFRLKSLLDLVREEALMQSRDIGVLFSESAYRFFIYDYERLAWLEPTGDRLLAEHELRDQLSLTLMVEDREIVLDDDFDADGLDEPQPQVLMFSSGEMTPFEAAVFRDFQEGRYILSAEIDGTIEISDDGFETR